MSSLNTTIDQLKQHKSIRRFTDDQIPGDLFNSLVEAGQAASTSSYIQATSVVRIKRVETLDAFVELSGGQRYIRDAAEFLVFCADLNRNQSRVKKLTDGEADYQWTEQFLAATVDASLFAQNVVVAAESAGLGCCYIGGIRNDPDRVTDLLELPHLVYPVFGLCIGYPAQNPDRKPRLPMTEVVHNERYKRSSADELAIDQYDARVSQYYRDRTAGKLSQTWSEQMVKQSASQSRPFMKKYLNKQGFMLK